MLVGDSGVGKSCVLRRYANKDFTSTFIATIGVDFEIKTIQIEDVIVKLQIWDTAGQERFQNVTRSYYRGAHCVIIFYDITQLETFEHVRRWYQEIKEHANSKVQVLLIGNKSDLYENRQVSFEAAEELANQLGISVFEVNITNESTQNHLCPLII